MVSRIWLFGLILGIPLVGIIVSEGIKFHLSSQLREAFKTEYPDVNKEALSKISVDRICESPHAGLEDLCVTVGNLNLISWGSIIAAVAGLVLMGAIRVAGLYARTNRYALLYLFKPGLYLTGFVLSGLVIAYAAIAIGTLYYGESALLNRVHVGIIAAIGIGAFLGVGIIISNVFSIVKKAQSTVVGRRILPEQSPDLHRKVQEIADKVGADAPEHIVVGLDPQFFVTQADVVCLDGKLSGRTLYCSLPLCRILTKSEFATIIGHELGHYKGLDTEFSLKFFPIYRGTLSAISELQQLGTEGARAIALLPAVAIFVYFFECFSVAENQISRDRELASDKEGANVADGKVMATALVKVHAFSGAWNVVQKAASEALKTGKCLVNASEFFAQLVSEHTNPNLLDGLGENRVAHPTDSHPPLGERLSGLGVRIEDVSESAMMVHTKESAIGLFSNVVPMEEDISMAYQSLIAHQMGLKPNNADQPVSQ